MFVRQVVELVVLEQQQQVGRDREGQEARIIAEKPLFALCTAALRLRYGRLRLPPPQKSHYQLAWLQKSLTAFVRS